MFRVYLITLTVIYMTFGDLRIVAGQDAGAAAAGPVCQDINASCRTWATNGECQRNPNYMNLNCKYSCKACVPDTRVCQDLNTNCVTWARSGECRNNPNYMNIECKRSCNLCTVRPICQDNNPSCQTWANRGECRNNPNYMNQECKLSCRACPLK